MSAPATSSTQVTRVIRTNVLPVVALTVGVFTWCLLELVGRAIPISSIIKNVVFSCLSPLMGKRKEKPVIQPGRPILSK